MYVCMYVCMRVVINNFMMHVFFTRYFEETIDTAHSLNVLGAKVMVSGV